MQAMEQAVRQAFLNCKNNKERLTIMAMMQTGQRDAASLITWLLSGGDAPVQVCEGFWSFRAYGTEWTFEELPNEQYKLCIAS